MSEVAGVYSAEPLTVSFLVRGLLVHQHRSGLVAWRHAIGDQARIAMGFLPALDGPVAVRARFALPRPRSRPKRDHWPDRRPDLDKLGRALLDALTGIVFLDDAQVVALDPTKEYAGMPGVNVSVWRMSA